MTTPTLTTIHLVGALGQAVGRSEWALDVKSVSEAVRAININTGGKLADYLTGPAAKHLYRIGLLSEDNIIDPTEATHRSGRATIFIMPAIKGRGDNPIVKALAGVALIALAFTGAGGLLGGTLQGFFGAASTVTAGGGYLAGIGLGAYGVATAAFGVSLLLGGVSQLLAPKVQIANTTADEQRASTTFPGNTTAVVQGGIIPVVYGRALVTPTPVSVTISNNDVSVSNAGTQGTVEATPLQGGGIQYGPGQLSGELD